MNRFRIAPSGECHRCLAALALMLFGCLALAQAQSVPAPATNVLTQARQVLDLALERARPGNIAVRVRGTVTYQDVFTPKWVFVQDNTAGILVILDSFPFSIAPGQIVEAEGVAEAGGIAPYVHARQFRLLGTGPMPEPQRTDPAYLAEANLFGHWVSITATVRDVALTKGRLVLVCADGDVHFQVWTTQREPLTLPTQLLDARVRLEGIPFTGIDDDGHPSGFRLHQSGTNLITILKPGAAGIFHPASIPISALRGRISDRNARVQVAGVVTFSSPEGWLTLEDPTGPLVAHLLKPIRPDEDAKAQFVKRNFPPLQAGDRIELVGALVVTNTIAPDLEDAEYRVIGRGPAPVLREVSADELAAGRHDGELITLQAQVVDADSHHKSHIIDVERHHDVELFEDRVWLQSDGLVFEALLESRQSAPLPVERSEYVAVSGVCRVEPGQRPQARPVQIYLRGPQDIARREPPPWWQSRRTITNLGMGTALALATAAWIILLRQRVAQRTAQLRAEIAERQKTEAHLVRFKAVIEATSDLVGISSLDGRTIYVNQAGRRMMEFPDHVAGEGLEMSRFYPQDVNRFFEEVAIPQAMRDGFWAGETRILSWNGREVPVSFVGSVVKSADGTPLHLACIARDISGRKKAEEELRWALAEEKELNRLKSNFISMVTHEIRTPLALILSSSEILSRYLDRLPPDKRAEHLRNIDAAVLRMSALMEDVLLFSKAEAGRMEFNPVAMDLKNFCSRLVDEITRATNGLRPVELSVGEIAELARGDENLLHHIFANLLANAVKYSTAGTPVQFSVTRQQGDADFIVRDRGMGISKDDLKRLFTPFYRGKNAATLQGTGLGLVIVKHCVERHGGSIEIQSAENCGTMVSVRLPLFSPKHTEFMKRISQEEET